MIEAATKHDDRVGWFEIIRHDPRLSDAAKDVGRTYQYQSHNNHGTEGDPPTGTSPVPVSIRARGQPFIHSARREALDNLSVQLRVATYKVLIEIQPRLITGRRRSKFPSV